jgi:uncharacterized protein
VNQQDKQAIEDLFQHLNQTAAQGGPRDRDAEALIQQRVQQGSPGLLYHMAQTLVGQQGALQQMRAQLADCQQQLQQSGSQGGFLRGWRGRGQQGYGGPGGYGGYGPPYQQPSGWQRGGGGGFLAGAGQIALGVGGGILAAEALGNLFSGEPLFGGDRDDDRGDDGDRDDRDDDRDDRGGDGDRDGDQGYDDRGQDYGGQDYGDGGYQDMGYDDGGGFDGGGFDDGGGW